MNNTEIKTYLETFVNFEKAKAFQREQFKLDRIFELLNRLGNPQKDLKVIHVAGSKGKGSTSVFIAHILKEAGYKVGLYTSPHLSDMRERIRLLDLKRINKSKSGIFEDQILEEELGSLLEEIKPVLESLRETNLGVLSYFEVLTALSFLYFKRGAVNFVVLETGLGGRLDATNAADSWMCVLTPISLEHKEVLGNTIDKIAEEKAQIIKSTTKYVIVSKQDKLAREVIIKRCKALGISPTFIEDNFNGEITSQRVNQQVFYLKGAKKSYEKLESKLLGAHQVYNVATAIGAIEAIKSAGYSISKDAIYGGIKNSFWPGRFEVFNCNPTFILDGAHNEASAQALGETFKEVFPNKKVLLILGVSNDKDFEGICKMLSSVTNKVILTKAENPRAANLDLQQTKKFFPNAECFQTLNVQEALLLARDKVLQDEIILVTGSLFVVAEARARIV